jgi:hypothetical protein
MSPLLSHTDRKGTRAAHLSKMVPITWCNFHYMVSRPDAVKAEIGERGSEKRDYRYREANDIGGLIPQFSPAYWVRCKALYQLTPDGA